MPAIFQCFTDVDDRHHEAVLNQGDHSRRNVKRFAFVVFYVCQESEDGQARGATAEAEAVRRFSTDSLRTVR